MIYHGTAIWKVKDLLDGKSKRFGGLYVTDTIENAMQYANAQVSGIVEICNSIKECAAIVCLETNDKINWHRRSDQHNTLDKSEASIDTWNIVSIIVAPPEYENSAGHKYIKDLINLGYKVQLAKGDI